MHLVYRWRGYLFACIITTVATCVRLWALQDILGASAPFALFYVSVTATAWYGGLKPGLLAVLLSALAVDYFYFPHIRAFLPLFPSEKRDEVKLVLFLLEGIIISLLCEELHTTRRILEKKTQNLLREGGEREKLAVALQKSEQEFRAIYELAAVGIVQVNLPTGRFLRVNQKFCDMLGYKKEDLLGRTFMEVTHPADQRRNFIELQHFHEGKTTHYTTEKRYIHKDGHWVWADLHVTMLNETSGQPRSTIGIIIDITARKQAEEALKQTNRRKDEFIATLAHELRNPLASISNSIQMLSLARRDKIAENALPILEQQVRYMVRLIDDLMDVARISQGKMVLNRENLVLADIIAKAVESTHSLFENKFQNLEIKIPQEPIWINGDMIRLTQICTNLLTNASKYTQNEGSIAIEVNREGQEVSIVVRDNGMGIQTNMLTRIFEMFTQANQQMGRYNPGLGIGLALTRKLVLLHGGNIEAYSEGVGKGSEFTVRFPVVIGILPRAQQPLKEIAPLSHRHHRVLIVDDNDASAKTIGWMMESYGHEYSIASSGRIAIELSRSFLPDIVLLDIGLPDMDGYEVCKKMRNEPALKDAIIIAQTGWGDIKHRQRSKAAGFNYHLIKPIDMNVLRQILEDKHTAASVISNT